MQQGDFVSDMSWSSNFVNVGDVRTHYLEAGDSGAPTVVLLHGGGAGADSAGNWHRTIPELARDFHVLALDLFGFGQTDKPDLPPESYSQAARNRHLTEFLATLGLKRVMLVGNSMGGATALGVAMEHPELVDRLVLMGSAGLNAEITESLKPIIFYDYTLEGMRRLIDALTGPRFEASAELVKFRYERSIEADTRRAYEATMAWIRQQGGLFYPEDAIQQVKTPTLIVNGKDDLVVPLKLAYRYLELLENSWGYLIPHCGHWAMLEAPVEFADVTRQFLAAEVRR
jgi:2-hydroxy-6-oxo-6-(2'-aminophenyl)hexa-2,4-dienoate hydrolase